MVIFLEPGHAQIQFQKTYTPGTFTNGPFADGYYIAQTADSGFIMTGQGSYTVISSTNTGNVFLLKTDKWGTVQWYKEYGGSAQEIGWWVEQTSDHGFIFSGSQRSSPSASQPRSYVGKTDSAGTLQWSWTYTLTGASDRASAIKQTADGGYIIAGHTTLPAVTDINACIIKLNANGTLQWMKTYSGTIVEWTKDILQTPDGGYVATGYTNSFGAGSEDILIMRIDSSGNLLWFKTYGGTDTDIAYSICFAPDGGYVVTGQTGGNGSDIIIIKVDTSGSLQWCRRYGNGLIDVAWSVKASPSGGYIVAGAAQNPSNSAMGSFALKTDSAGIREWYKFYNDGNYGNTIVQPTFDGGYVVGGKTSYGSIYLAKTDAAGNTGCNETTFSTTDTSFVLQVASASPVVASVSPSFTTPPFTTTSPSVTDSMLCLLTGEVDLNETGFNVAVYPNPFDEQISISLAFDKNNVPGKNRIIISIKNIFGTEVLQKQEAVTGHYFFKNIDVAFLSQGVYFLQVTGEKLNWAGKFVKE